MKLCMIGNSGHGLTILNELDRRSDLQLTGFCPGYPDEDCSGFEREVLKKRQLPVTIYDSYEKMLDCENPDLVVIDGRFCDHGPMAAEALRRNIHVYTDKPLATSEEDFLNLQEAQKKSRARVFAMMTMRYEDSYYTAREMVRSGAVGKVRMLNGQKSYRLGTRPAFFYDRKQFGGITPWVSIHMVDLIQWMIDKKCRTVFSMQDNHDNRNHGDLETLSLCDFEFEDHIFASIHTDYYRPQNAPTHGDDRLRIVGTEGILEVMSEQITLIDSNGLQKVELKTAPELFADCLRRIEEGDYSDRTDGMYSTYLSLKARESADRQSMLHLSDEEFVKTEGITWTELKSGGFSAHEKVAF